MAFTLPLGIRVAAGLLGTAIDRATKLPAELPSLAVSLAGQALRTSMRVQQELAELASRGDELLAPLTGRSQEHPAWATFDEDEDDSTAPTTRPPVPATVADSWTSSTGGSSTGAGAEPAVTLLDGTPVVDVHDPVVVGPGETVVTVDAFVVGPGTAPAALAGGTPGDVVVTDVPTPAEVIPVANARRTTSRASGRGTTGRSGIKSDHRLTIAELKERTQQMSVAEVRALLAQEEAGPNRAAYLTLLGNRLMTLQHEDR